MFRRDSMRHFLKNIVFLICFFSSTCLSATHLNNSYQAKLYFSSNNLEIYDSAIYIHLENTLIETNVIRTDQNGLYVLECDITKYEAEKERKWKCPYCHHWWPIGQKCQNSECPTNKW